jgi:hypothetical protein
MSWRGYEPTVLDKHDTTFFKNKNKKYGHPKIQSFGLTFRFRFRVRNLGYKERWVEGTPSLFLGVQALQGLGFRV